MLLFFLYWISGAQLSVIACKPRPQRAVRSVIGARDLGPVPGRVFFLGLVWLLVAGRSRVRRGGGGGFGGRLVRDPEGGGGHRPRGTVSLYMYFTTHLVICKYISGALVQWLKLPAWKVGDDGVEPRSGIQVSKKQHVSSPLTREDSILWGAYLTER